MEYGEGSAPNCAFQIKKSPVKRKNFPTDKIREKRGAIALPLRIAPPL